MQNKDKFFKNYFNSMNKCLASVEYKDLIKISDIFIDIKKRNKKIILLGNGASASISSHVSIDLTKAANIRSINFNEANLITCFSNDYGHENWMSNAINFYNFLTSLQLFYYLLL